MRTNQILVLLAAGGGRRFSDIGHKLLAQRTPEEPTVIELALRSALAAERGPLIVVTGALDDVALRTRPGIAELLDRDDVLVRHNPDWESGQASSIQVAVRSATELGADSLVVGLADQPFIDATAWQHVADGLGAIVAAAYDGRRGNPVRLHQSVWGLLPTSGDEGARNLMRVRPELVVEVPCSGSPDDIDTLEDLHRWQSNWSTNSP